MTIEVLNTGSELLLGEVVNSHAAWIGKRLFPIGLRISRQTAVPDGEPIRTMLEEACSRAQVVLVTGGLGPTTDDVTREIAASLLGRELKESSEIRETLESMMAARGIPLRERMLRQTMVPEGAQVLPNDVGTAPGLYFPATSTNPHIFLLPGPPRELYPMFEREVEPILNGLLPSSADRACRIYRIVGMGESLVEEGVGLAIEARGNVEVGYCARPNEVDLRLIAQPEVLESLHEGIVSFLGSHLISCDGDNLEEWLIRTLSYRSQTLATAESCTGGLVANRLTDVPGASSVFLRGYVCYANEAKVADLGVPQSLLLEHGAVSAPVAISLAEGARNRADSDYAISLTGIAGPGGGTPDKPIGTVFIALAQRGTPSKCQHRLFHRDRLTFKQLASQAALDFLRQELLKNPQPEGVPTHMPA